MAKALYKLANLQTAPTTTPTATNSNNKSKSPSMNNNNTNTTTLAINSGASSPVSKHKKSKGGQNYDGQLAQQVQKQVTKVSTHRYAVYSIFTLHSVYYTYMYYAYITHTTHMLCMYRARISLHHHQHI